MNDSSLIFVCLFLIVAFMSCFISALDSLNWFNIRWSRIRKSMEIFLDEHPELCPNVYDGKNMACKYCSHGKECKKDCRKEKHQKE